jgi:hypothetical protein
MCSGNLRASDRFVETDGLPLGKSLDSPKTAYLGRRRPILPLMFAIAYALSECDFPARNFLIVPKLHHNAAAQKLPTSKSLR